MKRNRKLILTLSLLLVSVLVSGTVLLSSCTSTEDPSYVATPSELEEDRVALATYIQTQRLERYMWYNKGVFSSILCFRIDNVRIYEGPWDIAGEPEEGGFYFWVSYSVRPLLPLDNDLWLTGNGTEGEDGWLTGMSRYCLYEREGSGYRLVTMATGL